MKSYHILFLLVVNCMLHAVTPGSVFSDNMVIQRDAPVRVWGTAAPGETVTVTFRGASASAVADRNGRWLAALPAFPASDRGAALKISGRTTVTYDNVLTGDIWLCAGQSNMQFELSRVKNGAKLAAESTNNKIRLLQIPLAWNRNPVNHTDAKWQECMPETAGNFSAVGYLFGRRIADQTGIPVGLINISWGGCRIEAMIDENAWKTVPVSPRVADGFRRELADMDMKDDNELREDKQRLASVLYNAMVYPLSPMSVKGMLWYQGEDNHTEGMEYAEKLQMLAYSWRKCFQQESMPVYIVQLPPFGYGEEPPFFLPRFRMAQQMFAQSDPYSGFIVTTDCGDPNDIHPVDKIPLVHRLADLALYKSYGIGNSEALAPTCAKIEFKRDQAVVSFMNANGLRSRDGNAISHLEIAGADKIFHRANGIICNDRLLVSSPLVKAPAYLRFGWHKTANPNLVNRSGNPVAPFSNCNHSISF